MPMTMPELLEFGFGIHPGMETFVSVMPEMTHALESIHKFSYHTRQCYLNDDRELFFFKNYTFLNCFQECVSNYTQQVGDHSHMTFALGGGRGPPKADVVREVACIL